MKELSKEDIRGKTMVRCLECFVRLEVPPKAKRVKCLHCGSEYFIYWPSPDVAKIKGPVT